MNQTNALKHARWWRKGSVMLAPQVELICAVLTGMVALAAFAGLTLGLPVMALSLAVVCFGVLSVATGWFLLNSDYPHQRLGLCNQVTLARLALVCMLIALMVFEGGRSWVFFGIAAIALTLDGVDGWLARRQGLVSKFGARFDVEVDSLLALVLAFNAALDPQISSAVLLLGLPRYAFCFATVGLPWLQRDLPERFSRKLICVVQIAVLIAVQAPAMPVLGASVLVPIAAAALIWSFAVDIIWLWKARS